MWIDTKKVIKSGNIVKKIKTNKNGKTVSELEIEYGIGHSTITNWINKYQKINTLSGKVTIIMK